MLRSPLGFSNLKGAESEVVRGRREEGGGGVILYPRRGLRNNSSTASSTDWIAQSCWRWVGEIGSGTFRVAF